MKIKKILSIVFVMAILASVGSFPLTAYADDTANNNGTEIVYGDDTANNNGTEIVYADETESEIRGNLFADETESEIRDNLFADDTEDSIERPFALYARFMANEGTSMVNMMTTAESTVVERDTVLMLDISDSMAGVPFTTMKAAAIEFCEQILSTNDDNRIALVVWDYSYYTYDFDSDIESVKEKIDSITLGGGTNTEQALRVAKDLMDNNGRDTAIKNIVLMTDGIPQHGNTTYSGQYTSADSEYYAYANTAFNVAKTITDDYYLYTLGFFHSLSGNRLAFAQKFLSDIQNAGYYEVIDADDLEFVFGEIADDIIGTKVTGTFRYISSNDNKDYNGTYYYDDAYFKDDPNDYEPSLATMSLCFAMASFGSNEVTSYLDKNKNAVALLNAINFTDIEANDEFYEKPTTDSIGVIAANKKIEDEGNEYTLIAVGVRGGGYEREWASNFTLGNTGQHQGFKKAKEDVLAFLKDYISKNEINGDIKLWITGFSRAAATANLVAGALDNGESLGSSVTLKPEDLYAYCFECPAGALVSEGLNNAYYNNIHNIINLNDPVPKVAPFALGFGRYGFNHFLPSSSTTTGYKDYKDDMIKRYSALENISDKYKVDSFVKKKVNHSIIPWSVGIVDDTSAKLSQAACLDELVYKFANDYLKNSRSYYVSRYQSDLREIFYVLNGADKLQGVEDDRWQNFVEIFQQKLSDNAGWLVVSIIPAGEKVVGSTGELIEEYAIESLNEAGITSYDKEQIHIMAESLASLLVEFLWNDHDLAASVGFNFYGIKEAHYPELCLAWLQSMDDNYTTSAGTTFSSSSYRIIRINCPVDAELFDASGNLVAAITSDQPQDVSGSSIISTLDEDGQKLFFIPPDADYSVNLTARDDGNVSYSINEFSANMGIFTRIINYFNIDVLNGDALTGSIPAFNDSDLAGNSQNGSSALYTLTGANGEIIPPDTDLKGEDAVEASCMVYVIADKEDYGMVTGQGVRQLGEYAKVTAEAYEGYRFVGWYVGNKCISTDSEYRFCVTEDVTLTAKFRALNEGGSSSDSDYTPPGTLVTKFGGTVKENGVRLIFPAGAVESNIWVYIKKASLTEGMALPENSQLLSQIVNIEKDKSGNFLKSVSITMLFDKSKIDPDLYEIMICCYDEDTNEWIALDNINLDFEEGSISGEVDHFTKFAVIATSEAAPAQLPAPGIPTDISDHWAKDRIMELINAGMVTGYPDGTFQPDKTVTRAEFTVMLVKALGLEEKTGTVFDDTAAHWAKDSIAAAAAHGLISGYDASRFGPDDLITREQAASIIARAAKLEEITDQLIFADSDLISAWAKPAVASAYKGGYISGYSDNSFKPQGNTTRAEAVVMIGKLL